MNDEDLAKRFGWWWLKPGKALRRAFPKKSSEEAILRWTWPERAQAARNYELASRAERGKRPRYLLGKRFDKLSAEEMGQVAKLWPRKPQPFQAFEVLPYDATPSTTEQRLRLLNSEEPLVLSSDTKSDREALKERARKRAELRLQLERDYAKSTGWTVPQSFTFNIRECGNTPIVSELKKWLDEERERYGVKRPKGPKGRVNRRGKLGVLFRDIEALDLWRNLPHSDKQQYDLDGGQPRRAEHEAKELRAEWEAANRAARRAEGKEKERIKRVLATPTPPQDMDAPNPLVAALRPAHQAQKTSRK